MHPLTYPLVHSLALVTPSNPPFELPISHPHHCHHHHHHHHHHHYHHQGGGRVKRSLHGGKKSKTADEEEFMGEIQRYIREREARLMSTAKNSGPGTGPTAIKMSGMKSQYEFELHQINANDPHNWDIDSGNRQRKSSHVLSCHIISHPLIPHPLF